MAFDKPCKTAKRRACCLPFRYWQTPSFGRPAGAIPLGQFADGRLVCLASWPFGWMAWDTRKKLSTSLPFPEPQVGVIAMWAALCGCRAEDLGVRLLRMEPEASEALATGRAMISPQEAANLLSHGWALVRHLYRLPTREDPKKETGKVKCWECKGRGRLERPADIPAITCPRCNGTKAVPVAMLRWVATGREMAKIRTLQGYTMVTDAKRRGISVQELDRLERGMVDPQPAR